MDGYDFYFHASGIVLVRIDSPILSNEGVITMNPCPALMISFNEV